MDNEGHNGKQRDRPGGPQDCRDSRSAEPNDVPCLRERVAGCFEKWGADLLLTCGAVCVSAGVGWIYPPAGLIAAGTLLIAGGILWARGGDGP